MKSSDSKQFHQESGEKLRVQMPSHLQEQALTVFQTNKNDQRALMLTFLMRKACRRLLGIEKDDDVEKLFDQALSSLPKHQASWAFKKSVHWCIRLRNNMVHKGRHATNKEVEKCQRVWRELRKKVADYLGMSAPETEPRQVQPSLARQSRGVPAAAVHDSPSPKTLWSRLLREFNPTQDKWKNSVSALLKAYDKPIFEVFRLMCPHGGTVAANYLRAFVDYIRSGKAFEVLDCRTGFRAFLVQAIWDYSQDNTGPEENLVLAEMDIEEIEAVITRVRAHTLYLDTLSGLGDRLRKEGASEDALQVIEDIGSNDYSLDELKARNPAGEEVVQSFLRLLFSNVSDEVFVGHGQNEQFVVGEEIGHLLEALATDKDQPW